ncbi:MAG: ROK family protein [Fimbriimonadaceae bacterium]|jgi:predicted NBD/HSP70 family sugar kinase|nr:ROK family protein [Fimbriimonadaceae bacterium]
MSLTIGIDLGGNSINVTALEDGEWLINEMVEIPAHVTQGPEICLDQLQKGFELALEKSGKSKTEVLAVGLDTPGPASADGVISSKGTTNFRHDGFRSFNIRSALSEKLGLPVSYLNDGNAAALYAHYANLESPEKKTSVSLIIGTGLGGGIVANGQILRGRVGFAAELGHVYLPYNWNPEGWFPTRCNCGKIADLESVASLTAIELNLLPKYLPQYPDHELHGYDKKTAAKKLRSLAEQGDEMALKIFRVQTYALAGHIDQMVDTLDPDAIFIGGGGVEATDEFRAWYLKGIQAALNLREEQADLPIVIIPDGDMAGARGAAVFARQTFG